MVPQLVDEVTGQLPLIVIVESDDVVLANQEEVVWFHRLSRFRWQVVRHVGAKYFEALWRFNQARAEGRRRRATEQGEAWPETMEEATMRLLFERATMQEGAPALVETPNEELPMLHVDPARLAPGHVPPRFAGRQPKCFFAMLKAFMGVALRGRAPEAGEVRGELVSNPSFARTCGFTMPDPEVGYRQSDVPSLRKLEQFDQIMTDNGLWDDAAIAQVRANIETGLVKLDPTLVHDTTHYPANSSMQVVELPEQGATTGQEEPGEQDGGPQAGKEREDGASEKPRLRKSIRTGKKKARAGGKPKKRKPKKKSHPKTTKNCRCKDPASCPHPWISADEGAGTVVKHGGKMSWAHKASTMSFAGQEGILLDAVAMTDGASHDSKSVVPHVARLFGRYPELRGRVTRLLDDSAADDKALKQKLDDDFSIELLASPNPRGRKPLTSDLPRGVDHITPGGTPVCQAKYPLDFLGCRHESKRFLFRAPDDDNGQPVCEGCSLKDQCCHPDAERRHVSVPFERLPWIDPKFPHLSVRHQREMGKRTVIERLHKLMKFDYGDERLTRRGQAAFQARLDKTLLAMHMALADDL